MAVKKAKQEIVTFKVDRSLLDVLKELPNRSEFIRRAILSSLENFCPLCQGSGVLSPNQQKHWDNFRTDHELAQCNECHEVHLVCSHPENGGR